MIGGSGRPTLSLLNDRSQTQLQVAATTGIANSTLSTVLHGKHDRGPTLLPFNIFTN